MSNLRTFRSLAVFCGSSNDAAAPYFDAARDVGRALAAASITIVYGGGRVGLMGAVADAALAAGGRVIGVIPEKLQTLEVGHSGLTELHVVPDMHTRKLKMATLSDGFLALPGGYGTLDEAFEAATWTQLAYHLKPVGLLNTLGYYDALGEFLARAARDGFVRPHHRPLVQMASTLDALLQQMATCDLPDLNLSLPRQTP